MKKNVIKIILLLVVIIFIVQAVFVVKFIAANKKVDSLYREGQQINNSLTKLDTQTLEKNFDVDSVSTELNSLKKEATENKEKYNNVTSFFINKEKKAALKKQQTERQALIDDITSEYDVNKEVVALLDENPFSGNTVSQTVVLKGDIEDQVQNEINEKLAKLPQSEKKDSLVLAMTEIRTENQKDKKLVALTFDDGPNDDTTVEILDILKKNNVKATFFVLGSMAESHPETLKRIADDGHEIGNHSYDHKNLPTVSQEELEKQIFGTNKIIKDITGKEPELWRPPYGAYTPEIKEMANMRLMLWNVDSLDWQNKNSQKTLSNINNNVKEGDIVLLHDIQPTSAAALQELIDDLKKEGYTFVIASDLPTE